MPSITASRRLEWLREQREAAIAEVTALTERAAEEDRDLTDSEHSSCVRKREAVKKYDEELAVEIESCERNSQYDELAGRIAPALTRSRLTGIKTSQPEPEAPVWRSSGEYLADVFAMRAGDQGATERLETFARAHQITTDNLPIVPEPVVAPVINDVNARRPAIDAATRRPLPPNGMSFKRPRITQHTAVGKQSAEKTTLDSRKLLMDELTIDAETFGGWINLSFQNRDRTSPAILDLLVSDLANQYAAETDADFCTKFSAAVTQEVYATTGATPVAADSDSWLGGIFDAAAQVFAAGNSQPDTIWASPDVWGALGRLTDGSGRPLFAAISPQNSLGNLNAGNIASGNVGGFRLVVDSNFAPGEAILGDSRGVEHYEQVGGMVSAIEPSVLGQNIAFWGMAATAVVRPQVFVRIIGA